MPENHAWHEQNRTYELACSLGAVIVFYGLLLCLHPWLPQAATVGSLLVFVIVVCDSLIPDHDTRMLGSQSGGCSSRIPLPEQRWTISDQRRSHDGSSAGFHGGLSHGESPEEWFLREVIKSDGSRSMQIRSPAVFQAARSVTSEAWRFLRNTGCSTVRL